MLFSLTAFSQIDTLAIQKLQQKIEKLQTELKNQKSDFLKKIETANNDIAALRSELENETATIAVLADSLGIKIKETQNDATQQIQNVRQKVGTNTLYWIIAVVVIALLSIALFVWLRKKQQSDKTDMVEQLSRTKSSIEESLVKEFNKQTELMDTQLELLKQQKTPVSDTIQTEIDHSLALKVASEINVIERNINLMDAGTKGLKQLLRSVEKLKDNLVANGYEMPQLLGKQFHQGMKVIVVNSVQVGNMEKGAEIISKVVIPQVNYNGKMIQTAQIEVSVG